jgi:hypothetical protein
MPQERQQYGEKDVVLLDSNRFQGAGTGLVDSRRKLGFERMAMSLLHTHPL